MVKRFIDAFSLEDKAQAKELEKLLHELETIPDSFCGLVWLHDHDWLWVSKAVEKVLNLPQENFLRKHGLLYFQSLTPPHWVNHIFLSLRDHISKIEGDPFHIQAPLIARVDAALLHAGGYEVPIAHSSAFIDYKPGQHDSYLILGCWLDTRNKDAANVEGRRANIEKVLLAIKDLYFQLFPERLEFCRLRQKITEREREVTVLLATGLSTKGISEKLGISFNTVETHRKNLLEKFAVRNTTEMINKARNVFWF
jgi:DNA-binding CsgD family transcriptional regulator